MKKNLAVYVLYHASGHHPLFVNKQGCPDRPQKDGLHRDIVVYRCHRMSTSHTQIENDIIRKQLSSFSLSKSLLFVRVLFFSGIAPLLRLFNMDKPSSVYPVVQEAALYE